MVFKSCGLYQTLISDQTPQSSATTEDIIKSFEEFDEQEQKAFLTLIFEHFKVNETLDEGLWKEYIFQTGKDVEIKLEELVKDDQVLKNILIRFCEVCKSGS